MTTIDCIYWAGHCVKCLYVASHFSLHTKSLQLCPALCNSSPLGSSVHEIFQTRILELFLHGCHALLQGIFPTQGLNLYLLCLLHWQVGSLPLAPLGKPLHLRFSSVQCSHSVVSDSLRPHGLQHARSPCPSPTPGVYPNSYPLSQWCHLTISSSVIPFSSRLQSFPASGSFQMSQLFASGGQSIGVSASISVLPMNTQDWSPLGWTGWISLQSKGL